MQPGQTRGHACWERDNRKMKCVHSPQTILSSCVFVLLLLRANLTGSVNLHSGDIDDIKRMCVTLDTVSFNPVSQRQGFMRLSGILADD